MMPCKLSVFIMQNSFVNRLPFLQFLKFGVVGFSNTIIGYVVYSACIWVGIHYLIANVVGFVVSVLNAFYWSDRFVFKKGEGEQRSTWQALIKTTAAYAITGIVLNSILLWLLIGQWHISEYLAPILILIVTVPTNFVLNKYWSFKTQKVNEED